MRAYRLVIEYDGRDFHGWQKQDDVRTVEGCLREAVSRLTTEPFDTAAASRTDTGVHALGQCVLVRAVCDLDPAQFGRAVAALMAADIGVVDCSEAAPGFQPSIDAVEKRYLYRVVSASRAPVLGRQFVHWVRGALDGERMREASEILVGTHDFSSFRNRSKDEPESAVRTIRAADWQQRGDHEWVFQVIGDGFLYRMVRNLVGTLLEVGRGKREPAEIGPMLAARDRRAAGPTVPPEALYLMEVAYPDTVGCELARIGDEPPRIPGQAP